MYQSLSKKIIFFLSNKMIKTLKYLVLSREITFLRKSYKINNWLLQNAKYQQNKKSR